MSVNEVRQIGFSGTFECLPEFDLFDSKEAQRSLFMNFFNSQVKKEFRFSKVEIMKYRKYHIRDIFINKINALLNVNFTPSQSNNIFYLDKKLTNTINSFINGTNNNPTLSPKTNRAFTNEIKVAFNLILMCFDGVKFQLKLDANKLFSEFVYSKIKRVNQDKVTSKCDNCIDIISKEKQTTTKVFTYWQFLNKQELNIEKAVSHAVETVKTTEFNQIYLVYPKHDKFNKHIQIRSRELEMSDMAYNIKLIPYSLRSILR